MDTSLDPIRLQVADLAAELGFSAFGVAPAGVPPRAEYFSQWVGNGFHGSMDWMARTATKRADPELVLPGARSLLCFAFNYYQEPMPRQGQVARYALGGDYHNLIYRRLKKICRILEQAGGRQKPYVDTGPVLEKPQAAAAGIGWQGKHTNLIHPKLGNWTFLAVILSTLALTPDHPVRDRCGSCSRCIAVCPTGAITGPYQLDASRCISYLTIEHHGPIPLRWREAIGDHLYGCDDCLAVCPWNRWAQPTSEAALRPRPLPDLLTMLGWTETDFQTAFTGSPIRRLKLARWKRNICVVLGNTGSPACIPALHTAAADSDPLVAEHASWALDRIRQRDQLS